MKSKKNTKILGLCISFACVAIGTIGLSTWLIGVEDTKEELSLTLSVDNVNSTSLILEATFEDDQTIAIAERVSYTKGSNDIIGTDDKGGLSISENSLSFSFSALNIYTTDENFDLKKYKLTIDVALPEENKISVKETTNSTTVFHPNETDFNYLTFNTISWGGENLSNKISKDNDYTSSNGLYRYQLNNGENNFKLEWGNFFEQKSPVNFYNEKYHVVSSTLTAEEKVSYVNAAVNEITTMKNRLEDATVKVTVTLETYESQQ